MLTNWARGAAAALALGSCVSLVPAAQAAPVLELNASSPGPVSVTAGNSFTLTLFDTINSSADVGAVDVTATFSTKLLQLLAVTDGSLLSGWNLPIFNPATGAVSISACNTCNDASGTGSVLSLQFLALAADPSVSTAVSVATNAIGALFPDEYQLAPTGQAVMIAAAGNPTSVPAPGLTVLFAPALLLALKLRPRAS